MSNESPLKVMVVDDTVFYRKTISDILNTFPDVHVVGAAGNGRLATQKIGYLKPDLITLDIEMPEMTGLEVLEWMKRNTPDIGSVIISSFAQKGGELTVKALELGAFDYIEKPDTLNRESSEKAIRERLGPILNAFGRLKNIRSILRGRVDEKSDINEGPRILEPEIAVRAVESKRKGESHYSTVVAIGISTGGPETLAKVLPAFPENIGVPILVVQHMPAAFTQSITSSLNSRCSLTVKPAEDRETVCPNMIYFAPGGKQMKVVKEPNTGRKFLRLTDDRPENNCKPSADYLFRSVAQVYGERATGVIMTGMGSDGTLGLKLMRRAGGFIIAQDEATCTVFGMPKAPIEAGIVDVIAPMDKVAQEILKTIKAKKR